MGKIAASAGRCKRAATAACSVALLAVTPVAPAAARPSPESRPVVVAGHESLAAAGEQRFALALARHAVRWLRENGLEADLADDAALATTLQSRRVAVLVYCGQLTAGQLRDLRAYRARGGKLIVCYSSSPELAELMGVRLGQYARAPGDGRWSRMRFATPRPANVPASVLQSSPNLFPATPLPDRARVLAWWEDRRGTRMPEAAWLESEAGFWMTHVLLADGDARAKGQLLLALIAACDPAQWGPAAAAQILAARRAGELANPQAAVAAAAKLADPAQRRRAATAAAEAVHVEQAAWALQRAGRGAEAWLVASDLRHQMLTVYGLLQQPRRGEIRGVWDHSGQGLYPGDWPRTCQVLKEAGFSDLFVNVAGAGFAHCRAEGLPASRVLTGAGDQLAQCLAAAHPLGLRVHAWALCFSTTQATPERLDFLRRKGWLLTDAAGTAREWIDPASPEARAHLVRAFTDLASRYPVDGLHLDFVRYPDLPSALGAHTRQRFEQARGRRLPDWPAAIKAGPVRAEFLAWRARQVTDFVADVRAALRRETPGRWLTAAVYGKYPSCVDAVGQAWEVWIDQGLIDYAAPMNYTEDAAMLQALLQNQTRTPRLRRHVLPGIGITAAESRLDAAAAIDQIRQIRAAGAPGFVLFDLDTTLERDILPVLRLGLTAPAAPGTAMRKDLR